MLNAGQRYLHAIANDRIIVDAQNGDLIGYLNFGFNAGVDDVRRNAVVVTENGERIAQRPDRVDGPSPAQSPVDVPAEAGAPASVNRQQSHTVKPCGSYRGRETSEPFLVHCVIAEWGPDKILEVSLQKVFGAKASNRLVVLHHTGNSQVLSNRRDFDDGNTGGKHVFRQIFPMSNERQNPVTFPSDRDCGVINHIGNDMPIMFGGIAGRASIEPMMGGSQCQQDGSFTRLWAHFAMILA